MGLGWRAATLLSFSSEFGGDGGRNEFVRLADLHWISG